MQNYRLSELIDVEALQSMADSLFQSTGMPMGIIDAVDNSILVGAGWQDICTKFHRMHPETLIRCQESDNYIKKRLKNEEVCQYKCQNGLWDIGIPIIVSGRHLATMFLGQFFHEDEIPEKNFFVKQGEKFGFDTDQYMEALDQVPHFSNEKIKYILSYNQSFIGIITKLAETALSNTIAERQLWEQNQIMAGVLDHTHMMAAYLDRDFNFIWANRAYAETSKTTASFLKGKNHFELYPHKENQAIFQSVVDTGEPFFVEAKPFEFPDQPQRGITYWDWSLIPVKNESDTVMGLVFTLADVTRRVKAEKITRESEQRFRIMADGTPVVIWVHDARGNIEFINTAYSRFFGVDLKQIRGQNWQPLIHPDDRKRYVDDFMHALKDQTPFHAEARVKNAKGEWRWIESYGSPRISADGSFSGMVGSSPDITDRKEAEETLKKLNEALEQKVSEQTRVARERAENLQKLVGELTLAEQKERQRLAAVLHDHLQQLLVGARINSEILCRNTDKTHEKFARNAFDLINKSLETSRSLTAELYPAALQQGLSAALKWTKRWMSDNHGLTIDLNTDPAVDPIREEVTALLYQSTRELLLNVVKHSGVTSACVEMTCDQEQKQLRVTVSDQGAGFDSDAALKNKGTGFGLFSIDERLQLMGGSLRIETAPGNGASVSLIVPFETKEKKEDEAIREIRAKDKITRKDGNQIRTLVVDDHTVVRQGISVMLSFHSDIELVGEAGNGQEAVEQARNLHPDVILMDINMPVMDGVQATRIIRSELPDVRIIGLSMHDKQDLTDQMIQAGASAYFTKDGSTDELLSEIRRSD